MAKYQCVLGAGNFVPGLPFEISDEEAKIFGLEKLLADAIKDGAYKEIGESASYSGSKARPKSADHAKEGEE